jgi:hypothetical protein
VNDDESKRTKATTGSTMRPSSKHASYKRRDEPAIEYGDGVWWNGEYYIAEAVELHGEGWKVCVVKPQDFGTTSARAYFAPIHEVEVQ